MAIDIPTDIPNKADWLEMLSTLPAEDIILVKPTIQNNTLGSVVAIKGHLTDLAAHFICLSYYQIASRIAAKQGVPNIWFRIVLTTNDIAAFRSLNIDDPTTWNVPFDHRLVTCSGSAYAFSATCDLALPNGSRILYKDGKLLSCTKSSS